MASEDSDSFTNFSKQLSDADIVAEELLRTLQSQFRAEQPDGDGEAFGLWLLERKSLTRYQLNCLQNNDGSPLCYGSYVILDELGIGGMGKVYLARHRHMNRQVAVKVLFGRHREDEKSARRFLREIETTAKLHHVNIAAAYDAGESDGVLFYAMEFVDGPNLRQLVEAEGKMSPGDAVECVLQTAQGLAAAHQQGIVHRDVKPSNLVLSKDRRVKILDLGIAGFIPGVGDSGEMLTATDGPGSATLMGTLDYMAPEQADSIASADHRSDIYSLGCTLFFLLTGKPIFTSNSLPGKVMAHRDESIPNLTDLRPDISEHLNEIFRKMVAKEPQERFQSMNDVIEALTGMGTKAPRTQIAETTYTATEQTVADTVADTVKIDGGGAPPVAGKPLILGVAAVLAVVAAGLAVKSLWQPDDKPQPVAPLNFTGDGSVVVLKKVEAEAIWPQQERITSVAVTPDGKYVISSGTGRGGENLAGSALVVRDIASGVEQGSFDEFTGLVRAMAVSPDGNLMAASDSPANANIGALSTVQIVDRDSGELVRSFQDYVGEIRSLQFHSNGKAVLAGCANGSVMQIDLRDEKYDRELLDFEGQILALQNCDQSGSGNNHAVIGTWHHVSLVDLDTGEYIRTVDAHEGPVLAVMTWKSGDEIVSGGDDGFIRRWSSEDGNLIKQIAGHSARITRIVAVDDRHLLSSSDDGSIRLWDAVTGEERARFEGHRNRVTSIALLPGAEYFVSGGEDRTVRLWKIPSPHSSGSPSGSDPS